MNHDEAERLTAVEKYLLHELPPATRDEFEAHFFECADCAADLRATAAFMEAAKRGLQHPAVAAPPRARHRRAWFAPSWSLPVVSFACAALFAVVLYQNVMIYPGIARTAAALNQPQILASLSLVGGDSRGGAVPAITVTRGAPFLLSLDVPTSDRFVRYTCVLESSSGAIVWHLDISAAQAKDTLAIRVPSAGRDSDEYSLVVQGSSDASSVPPVDLARYRFRLNSLPE